MGESRLLSHGYTAPLSNKLGATNPVRLYAEYTDSGAFPTSRAQASSLLCMAQPVVDTMFELGHRAQCGDVPGFAARLKRLINRASIDDPPMMPRL